MTDNWEDARKGWESHRSTMKVWLWVKERGKKGNKYNWMLLGSPYSLRKVGQGHWGVLRPKLPNRRVLHPSGIGLLNISAVHGQSLGAAHGKCGFGTNSAMDLRAKQLQPLVPTTGDLRSTFSWLPQTATFYPLKKRKGGSSLNRSRGLYPNLLLIHYTSPPGAIFASQQKPGHSTNAPTSGEMQTE